MNSFKVLIAAAILALGGCATFGVPTAETANEKTVFAYKAVATAADSIGILLDAGKLDLEGARSAHTRLTEVKKGIDVSIELRNAGDFSQADTRLAAAIAALEILQAELDAKKGAGP